jgi:vancomycin resistance protein YoaR
MKARVPAILLLILTTLFLCSVFAFERYQTERIYPGVWVWGTDMSGLSLEEATAALEDSLELGTMQVTLRGPDRSWGIRPTDLGIRLHSEATLAPAYTLGREGTWSDDLATQVHLLIEGKNLPPVAVYDEQTARRYLKVLAEEIYIPPTDASLSLDGTTPVVNPAQPGRYLDIEATLEALSPAVITLRPVTVHLVVHEIPPPIANAEPARAEAQTLLDGPVTLTLAHPREGDPGPWVIMPEQLATMLVVHAEGGELHAALNEDALRVYVAGIAPSLEVGPVDARFQYNKTTGQLEPTSPSIEGRTTDVGASTIRIVQELAAGNRYISLVMLPVPPRYPDTATAEEIGVTDLVAEGESYFIGSPAGRDHNIRLAATKFHGVVVAPGETFSFNHYLGPVTEEEGYDESFITAGEELQMGIGGGICQVSTTAFRAAFWGGYPIVERWYHYQRVGYYELRGGGVGMDATVYSPHVDLKFVNDRPYPLLVQTEVGEETHRLVFRFYSTDDGRRVEMEGPEVTGEMEPGPPIYSLDEEMAPGTVVKWQSAVGGLTATVVREVYGVDENLISRDVFVSKYAPRSAAYHYGPGYVPPAD